MTLYQVILNSVNEYSPLFESRSDAESLLRRWRDHVIKRGCEVIVDTPDRVEIIWDGWREQRYSMWIREVRVGKIPTLWECF